MRRAWVWALVIACSTGVAAAQDDDGGITLTPLLDLEGADDEGLFGEVEEVEQPNAAVADGGVVVRALDKVTGNLADIELTGGQSQRFGRLAVTLGECRYPVGNPAGDAYAFLVIRAAGQERPVFEGWMIASSPALNALDHPRYDVWVLRCITS